MNNQNNEDLRIVLGEPGPVQVQPEQTPGDQPSKAAQAGKDVKEFVKKSISVTFKYFAAKLLVSVIITIVCYIVLAILDVKLAMVWAMLAGVGNFIPVFGQWIGMIGAIGGAWLVSGDWKVAVYTLITILVLQVLDEFLFTPLLVGKATSIKPLLIIIVMLLASSFLGFWGVVFAVPIAAIIKLAYEIFWASKRKKDSQNSENQ